MVSAKWQPSDEVLRVARRLAEAAMVATDRRNRLVVMLQLAEDLRRVVAGNLPSEQAATTRALLAEELGRLRPGTVWQQVAALRMVARLTLGECAELLGRPREQLALVWRATQLRIFQSVRQRLKSSGERETR
jgi:predicted component of type VI protein secretion system